jgi:putative transposase
MYTNTNWSTVNIFRDRANRIDSTEHFRLKNYDVTLKEVAQVRYGSHCKYNINYHFVWIPKTRMKILVEPFKSDVEEFIMVICKREQWFALALEIMPDHLHFFVSAHPKWAPMRMVKLLKEETSRRLRAKYATIRQTRENPNGESTDFWATGYYCGTAGHVSAAQVARYIMDQTAKLKKDWKLYNIQPFEYNIDEVRIDKAQTKLAAYGGL